MTSISATPARASSFPTSQRIKALTPTSVDLVDAGFLVGMVMLAFLGFRTTFDSPVYLAAGAAGLLLGLLIAHVARVLRAPILVLALLVVVLYFLVGGAIGLRDQNVAGVVPTPSTVAGLSSVAVGGWKDLLTTLPPIDSGGQLVLLPYLLGLLGGAAGFTIARRSRASWTALLTPSALVGAVILLGTRSAAAALPIGLGTALFGIGWLVIRARRRSLVTLGGAAAAGRNVRLATGAALLLVAGVASVAAVPALQPERERVVLRTYVEPPFDPTAYASPLAGFRKYAEGAKLLWDQTLLTTTGLPAGSRLRFATLDAYSGTVWGAGTAASDPSRPDTYQRVGTTIDQPGAGTATPYTVTIGTAYAAMPELGVWLPAAGPVTHVEFTGPTGTNHTGAFRYNLGASQGIVPDRLRAGDTVQLTGSVTAVSADGSGITPGAGVVADSSSFAFLAPQATKWGGGEGAAWTQLMNVAKHLATTGAYSDGLAEGETQYLPGHGVGRILKFVNAKQAVGNDEQYAATLALLANQLGVPARVVLGAAVEDNGVVRGQDVHAWVEVLGSDGTWIGLSEKAFMPDRNKRPDAPEPDVVEARSAQMVPPPQASRPPGSVDALGAAESGSVRPPDDGEGGFHLPGWAITTIRVASVPLGALVAFTGAVLLAKSVRRRRRRSRGSPTTRLSGGWREIVDRATDLGVGVPRLGTRREQGQALGVLRVGHLADLADAGVFGPGDPDEAHAAGYWSEVDAARRSMVADFSLWRRWRTAVSLRSLVPAARPTREALS